MAFNRDGLQLSYDCHDKASKRNIWVEPVTFVRKCIKYGLVAHRLRRKEGMGGRIGRYVSFCLFCICSKICRLRNEFTAEDEEHLCKYLAIRIPDKSAGGRLGKVVYLEMESMVSGPIS